MKLWPVTAAAATAFCARASARRVVVEHAFGPQEEFSYRGTMDLVVDPAQEVPASATLSPVALGLDASRLEDLIANGGLYLIRVATDDSSAHHVTAAVPALVFAIDGGTVDCRCPYSVECHLRLASFREEITLHVEWDGLIAGLDYKAPVGPLASTKDCTKMPVPEASQVLTSINVVRAANAQSVPLQVLAPNPPPGLMNLKEDSGKQDPKAEGNQSILFKYWYIFVPLMLSWMFTAGGAPEQGGASGPASGAQGPGS